MTEDFLHYVWKYRLFSRPVLTTVSGKSLTILHPGQHNFNAGPDFLNARLRIGTEQWIGHVEIHKKSSDWNKHGHDTDDHYNNVILHAVFENDQEIFITKHGDLEALDISQFMIKDQWERYTSWQTDKKKWIPCEKHFALNPDLEWMAWKDRLLVERLESRTTKYISQLKKHNNNWSEVFYQQLAANFGFRVNTEAMLMLSDSISFSILEKHKSDPFQMEALLFGQAGLLNEIFSDEYPMALRKEYLFLNSKYQLRSLNQTVWNFGRLRPGNFPTIRIAQLATLLSTTEHLMSRLIHGNDISSFREMLDINPHSYWNDHYRFDALTTNETKHFTKRLGQVAIDNIMINTVASFLFAYGMFKGQEIQKEKAIRILEQTAPEDNKILRKWSSLGMQTKNAADSQSMLQLFNIYCTFGKCLDCNLGLKFLNREKTNQ